MRIWHLATLFVVAFIGFLVAWIPLGTVLNMSGLSGRHITYDSVAGTIWGGRIDNMHVAGVHLGTVYVVVAPLDLLRGRLGVSWSARGRALRGGGRLARSLDGMLTLSKTRIQTDLAHLPTWTPMDGAFDMDVIRFTLADRGCTHVEGRLRSSVSVQYRDETWSPPDLAGEPQCVEGAVLLPLKGEDGRNAVDLALRVAPDRRYEMRLRIETQEQNVKQAMELLGFESTVKGYEFVQEGKLGDKRPG